MLYASFETTPNIVAKHIAPLIKNKIVYDVGCGDGKFASAMQEFASNVYGIESQKELQDASTIAGVEIIGSDFTEVNYKETEVIFAFLSPAGMWALNQVLEVQGWKGTLLSHLWPLRDPFMQEIQATKVITVEEKGVLLPILVYEIT